MWAWLQISRSGRVRGFQGDLVAQALKLADEAVLVGVAGVAVKEVVGAEVGVGLPTLKEAGGDHQDRVRHRDRGALVPASSLQPGVLGGQVGALGP